MFSFSLSIYLMTSKEYESLPYRFSMVLYLVLAEFGV